MIPLGSAERLASVGSLAVRPTAYLGRNGGGPFATSNEPISGLSFAISGRKERPLFHRTTNVYGFLDLPGGPVRVEVTDPEGRYLPRALLVDVPDRLPLAAALSRGASALPAVTAPPFVAAPLRPSPRARSREPRAAIFGRVTTPAGVPCPFAWVSATTAQGAYVTYADERGEYLAPLPFLRAVVSVADPHLPGDGDDDLEFTSTFDVTVRAYRRVTPPPQARPLEGFLDEIDTVSPMDPAFAAVYGVGSLFETTLAVKLETHVRLDLLPA
ncbi:hypothetical protein WME91_16035 [Sorangium sp. So ce269]